MTARWAWCIALAWATIVLGSCDTNPAAPDADALSLAANPGNPIDLRATAASPTQIDLEWQDMSAREDGFELHRSTTGAGGPFGLFFTTGPNVTAASDFLRTPATEYCYKVLSFRYLGRKTSYSGFSNTECETTPDVPPPNAPSALYAIPVGSTVVQVGWTNTATDATRFKVERSSDPAGPWNEVISTPYTGFYDAGLTSDAQVCYRAIAVNAYLRVSSPSNIDCTAPPAAPTLTAVTPTPSGLGIQLTWTPSAVAENYDLRRRFEYCGYYYYCTEYYWTVAFLGPTETSYLDLSVSPGEYHSYYVIALNDGGQSDQSNIASATAGEASGSTSP